MEHFHKVVLFTFAFVLLFGSFFGAKMFYIDSNDSTASVGRMPDNLMQAIRKASIRWKQDPRMMYAVCMIETSCNPKEYAASTSSAVGPYQYIQGTWLRSLKKYARATNNTYLLGLNRSQALSKRMDVYVQAEVFAYDSGRVGDVVNALSNRSGISKGTTRYLMHFSPKVAKNSIYKNKYQLPFSQVISSAAARANGFSNKSFGQVLSFFNNKYTKFANSTPRELLNVYASGLQDYNMNNIYSPNGSYNYPNGPYYGAGVDPNTNTGGTNGGNSRDGLMEYLRKRFEKDDRKEDDNRNKCKDIGGVLYKYDEEIDELICKCNHDGSRVHLVTYPNMCNEYSQNNDRNDTHVEQPIKYRNFEKD